MRFSRRSRHFAALLALVSLLFAQGALSLYQCPGDGVALVGQTVDSAAGDAMRSMPGCDGMDLEQPALCRAHAQAGNQSLDKPPSPDVPAFMPSGLFFVLDAMASEPHRVFAQPNPWLLTRSTAPPIAVRNCCFRI
jgi:hypothetical protein